jgi:hypothetical protein
VAVTGDALPVTALLASEPGVPVVVFDSNAALRMAVVDRQSVHGLDESWDAPGVYLLLDPVALDGVYGVYVGKAPAGLRTRLKQHLKGKDHWARALLVVRDTTHGWHSAQVGWLEGRLYDLLDGASLAHLSNGNRPQDETLPAYDRSALEAAVEPIAAVMRFLGCSPDVLPDAAEQDVPEDDADAPIPPGAVAARRRSIVMPSGKAYYGVSLLKLMESGDLSAGEVLHSTQRSAPARARLNAGGTLSVEGETFESPSSAGRHVLDGKAINGWAFWAVERDGTTVPLATVRARYLRRTQPQDS